MTTRPRFQPDAETLEDRRTPAVTLAFDSVAGKLTVTGDGVSDTITLASNTAGVILLNGASTGHNFTDAKRLEVFGNGGSDTIDLSGLNTGALPAGTLVSGGDGNDAITGGSGNETIDGGDGTDKVVASGNGDFLLKDAFLSSPAGFDTLISIEKANLTGGDGNNKMDGGGFAGSITMEGGDGNDTLIGGPGNDTLKGGVGDDVISGNGGDDLLLGDSGLSPAVADVGADVLRGGDGNDTLQGDECGDPFKAGDRLFGDSGDDRLIADPDAPTTAVDGGAGQDELVSNVSCNPNFGTTLTDGRVTEGGLLGVSFDVTFTGVEQLTIDAELVLPPLRTGDSADLDISGFTGTATITDTVGTPRLVSIADGNQTLTNTSLLRGGRGPITLTNWRSVALIGGNGNDTLDASGFTGTTFLNGQGGDDRIIGGSGSDTIDGKGGADVLTGGPGDDHISGGFLSDDTVQEQADVNFTLTDGSLIGLGHDTLSFINRAVLTGGAGNNVIDATGFGGKVTANGLGGNDTLRGGGNDDVLDGGDGNDQIFGRGGRDTLFGQAGDDTLRGEDGDDTLQGDDGDDNLGGGDGNDLVLGGNGTDKVTETATTSGGLTLTNSTLTGRGNDTLTGIEKATLNGGSGNNLLDAAQFTAGSVELFGLDGDDLLKGGPGNDGLFGGPGNDVIGGNAGDDTLRGDVGDDLLNGGVGNDTLQEVADVSVSIFGTVLSGNTTGGLGNDVFTSLELLKYTGGLGSNTFDAGGYTGAVSLDGSLGSDTLIGGSAADTITGGGGNDTITGNGGADAIDGGVGTDTLVEVTIGTATLTPTSLTVNGVTDTLAGIEAAKLSSVSNPPFPDTLDASAFTGPVTLLGGGGNDVLIGGSGDDTIAGGSGSDTIFGGPGNDTVTDPEPGDVIDLGAGEDGIVVTGTTGNDVISIGRRLGGDGSPRVVVRINGSEYELAYLNGETVTVKGRAGKDRITIEDTLTWSAVVHGGPGADTLESFRATDLLDGGPGRNRIIRPLG